MRAELANINHCAVPFLSRAAVNLSWYDSSQHSEVQIENVNEYPNTFFNTLIIYSTMGNFRPPHLTRAHVYN